MDTFLAIGALLFIWMWVFVLLSTFDKDPDRIVPYALLELFVIGAIIGIIRQEFPMVFMWVIKPAGYCTWGIAFVSLICAHHNGDSIWLSWWK
jgi:hypothetical protein